jgi:cytochrome P450
MYGAAGETTFASLTTFILAMIFHPHVMRKAQAEIDRVVGNGRLPTFKDRHLLPYVEAVLMETMRWKPALPLGVAHRSMEDDEYQGFFIPSQTIVMPNVWAISQNPTEYPNPTDFQPERFIPSESGLPMPTDPREYAFGFGRRICAGKHFADATLFIGIASILATFDILKEVDPVTGLEVDPRVEYTTGFVSHAEPFKCRFIPRATAKSTLAGAC